MTEWLMHPCYPHELVMASATYAPWLADGAFLETYRDVGTITLVDLYRQWELWSMVGQSARLPKGCLVEVGCWRGGTAVVIGKRANLAGIKDTFYIFDTFSGVPKELVGIHDTYKGGEHADVPTPEEVTVTLVKRGVVNFEIIREVFPDARYATWTEPIRFAHLDVDVYESAKRCTEAILPRLVTGGVIVYDDYGFKTTPGVTRFVNELIEQGKHPVIHNLNGHAVLVKT